MGDKLWVAASIQRYLYLDYSPNLCSKDHRIEQTSEVRHIDYTENELFGEWNVKYDRIY